MPVSPVNNEEPSTVRAEVIITNLETGNNVDAGVSFIGSNRLEQDISHTSAFQTAPDIFFRLDNIRVRLGGVNGLASLDATDDPLIRLFSGVTVPTTELVTFTDPVPRIGRRNYRLEPTVPVILSPSTVYWIVVENANFPAGALYGWLERSDVYEGSASYVGATVGVDAFPTVSVNRSLGFEVNGTRATSAISAPVTLALVFVGLAAIRVTRHKLQ